MLTSLCQWTMDLPIHKAMDIFRLKGCFWVLDPIPSQKSLGCFENYVKFNCPWRAKGPSCHYFIVLSNQNTYLGAKDNFNKVFKVLLEEQQPSSWEKLLVQKNQKLLKKPKQNFFVFHSMRSSNWTKCKCLPDVATDKSWPFTLWHFGR